MQAELDFGGHTEAAAPMRWLGVCAFNESGIGWLGPHHCFQCATRVAEMCNAFDADVASGKYDAQGYTKAERRAKDKRR